MLQSMGLQRVRLDRATELNRLERLNILFRLLQVVPVVMYGCESWSIKKVNPKELMLLNCGIGEDS